VDEGSVAPFNCTIQHCAIPLRQGAILHDADARGEISPPLRKAARQNKKIFSRGVPRTGHPTTLEAAARRMARYVGQA
jgi:hypothetical protein